MSKCVYCRDTGRVMVAHPGGGVKYADCNGSPSCAKARAPEKRRGRDAKFMSRKAKAKQRR